MTEPFRLTLSRNHLRNCTIMTECDSESRQILFVVSTPKGKTRVSTIKRCDQSTGKAVLVAEWERNAFQQNRLRMAQSAQGDFIPADEILHKTSTLSANRTFLGVNGVTYLWRSRAASLKLFAEGSDVPVASFHRRNPFKSQSKSFLEIWPEAYAILDMLIGLHDFYVAVLFLTISSSIFPDHGEAKA
ncbi:hypothetical protein BD410DRAFT_794481 [Rickenella mellea]|uniref:DUF6593 domain-containing protein n=1 Tax=Rickenella mellea TaxID=50990 RepID=A0A4Y7PQ63_9AGAM|nr:hypothetical protein BD410DRAFT_794481 [Rickenella mellea]